MPRRHYAMMQTHSLRLIHKDLFPDLMSEAFYKFHNKITLIDHLTSFFDQKQFYPPQKPPLFWLGSTGLLSASRDNLTTLSEADNSARVRILKRMYNCPSRPFKSGVPKMGGRNYNLGIQLKSPQVTPLKTCLPNTGENGSIFFVITSRIFSQLIRCRQRGKYSSLPLPCGQRLVGQENGHATHSPTVSFCSSELRMRIEVSEAIFNSRLN